MARIGRDGQGGRLKDELRARDPFAAARRLSFHGEGIVTRASDLGNGQHFFIGLHGRRNFA